MPEQSLSDEERVMPDRCENKVLIPSAVASRRSRCGERIGPAQSDESGIVVCRFCFARLRQLMDELQEVFGRVKAAEFSDRTDLKGRSPITWHS